MKLVYTQEAFDSYCQTKDENGTIINITFTDEELQNEEWKCLSNISIKYKGILENLNNIKTLSLYNESSYYISNLGRIAYYDSLNNQLMLLKVTDDKGYKKICINKYKYFIHRLVALLFIDNEHFDILQYVNHINTRYNGNKVSNLEWTDKHGNRYNSNDKEKDYSNIKGNDTSKVILYINLVTLEIQEFESINKIASYLNCTTNTIRNCINTNDISKKVIEYNDSLYTVLYKYSKDDTHTRSENNEPIVQLSNLQEFIKVHLDFIELQDITKHDKAYFRNILHCCRMNREKQNCSHGSGPELYKWMFLTDYIKFGNETTKNFDIHKLDSIFKLKFVQLTRAKKFIKIWSILDIINDKSLTFDNIIRACYDPNKSYNETIVGGKGKYYKWLFLNDYLRIKQISSLDELTKDDMININQSKATINGFNKKNENLLQRYNLTYSKIEEIISNIKNRYVISEEIPIDINNREFTYIDVEMKDNITQETYEMMYGFKFTEDNLRNEKWYSISKYMNSIYKEFLKSKNSKEIKLYKDQGYFISNLGRIGRYSKKKDKILLSPLSIDKDNYRYVNIYNEKYALYRLVAYIFCINDDIENKTEVHHIDYCVEHNWPSNLEWCTQKYNLQLRRM